MKSCDGRRMSKESKKKFEPASLKNVRFKQLDISF